MRMPDLAIVTLLTLTGCSFRAPSPYAGQVLALSAEPTHLGATYAIQAQVQFLGDVEPPMLSVVPGASDTTLQVMAVSQAREHFLGLGIFPVDATTPHVYNLSTSVVLPKSTTYRIEGLSSLSDEPDAHAVTASIEVHRE